MKSVFSNPTPTRIEDGLPDVGRKVLVWGQVPSTGTPIAEEFLGYETYRGRFMHDGTGHCGLVRVTSWMYVPVLLTEGLVRGAQRIERAWDQYPLGTKAHAPLGGWWLKVANGWEWPSSGVVFGTPGGDACAVTLPEQMPERDGEIYAATSRRADPTGYDELLAQLDTILRDAKRTRQDLMQDVRKHFNDYQWSWVQFLLAQQDRYNRIEKGI